jgi:hypothetical protein
MSTRQFLLCDSYEHAHLCDQLVLSRLETEFGIRANAWSEVYSDGERWGIYWGAPVSDIFGYPPSVEHPEGDPAVVIVDEDPAAPWEVVRPEPEAPDEGVL